MHFYICNMTWLAAGAVLYNILCITCITLDCKMWWLFASTSFQCLLQIHTYASVYISQILLNLQWILQYPTALDVPGIFLILCYFILPSLFSFTPYFTIYDICTRLFHSFILHIYIHKNFIQLLCSLVVLGVKRVK